MKRKSIICLQCLLLLTACQNPVESSESNSIFNSESISVATPTYQIKVVDLDGEELGSATININKQSSVFNDLINNFAVDYTVSDYGPYISSINGSIVDVNYFLAIYENGVSAATGVDGLVADENDVFEFKVECWNTISSGYGTMDEYDMLVDKVIYGYMKTLDLSSSTTFADGSFWDLMTINLGKNNYYDANLFNYDNISDGVKEELETYDISTLDGANLYKYYLYSRALDKDLSALKTHTSSYVETLSDEYNDYVSPFIVAASYGLNVESEKINTLVNAPISTNFTWGPDVPVWQYTTSSLFNQNVDNATLNTCVETLDYGNSCSNALVLQAFAAANENIRDGKYEVEGKDLIEVLFDNYYNESNNTLDYTKGVANTYSTNQVIVSLMAYKVNRDAKKAVNIYG